MNRNSFTIRLIETSLHRLEIASESPTEQTVMEALGVLDEIRRLERKWREQVAAGSPRRIDSDFATMNGWYRRWRLAAGRLLDREDAEPLRRPYAEVDAALKSK